MENNQLYYSVNTLEQIENIAPYIGNTNKKVSGLIDSSLEGYILNKPYMRPDKKNLNGVFAYFINK